MLAFRRSDSIGVGPEYCLITLALLAPRQSCKICYALIATCYSWLKECTRFSFNSHFKWLYLSLTIGQLMQEFLFWMGFNSHTNHQHKSRLIFFVERFMQHELNNNVAAATPTVLLVQIRPKRCFFQNNFCPFMGPKPIERDKSTSPLFFVEKNLQISNQVAFKMTHSTQEIEKSNTTQNGIPNSNRKSFF